MKHLEPLQAMVIANLINDVKVAEIMAESDVQPIEDWKYWTYKRAIAILELANEHGIELVGLERAKLHAEKYATAELSEVA